MNNLTLKVHGYCDKNLHELRELLIKNCFMEIKKEKGAFIVIAESMYETTIITSENGIVPYYYFYDGSTLFHGSTVTAICAKSKLAWKWDFNALGDYLAMDHTIGESTLHPLIKRTQPGSIVSVKQGQLSINNSADSPNKIHRTHPDELIEEISQEVLHWWLPSECILSMTGGFDSRLLLAILISSGNRPQLLVCGQDSAFDLVVAKEISSRLKLDLIRSQVYGEDFLHAASSISRETNGLLPVSHWPGVLFAKEAQSKVVFVGFNGEIARSYYDDNGIFSLMRYGMHSRGKQSQKFWIKKFYKAFMETDYGEINPDLAQQFSMDGHICRVNRLMGKERQFGLSLDNVFSHQYIRHKTGADIAALSLLVRWVAPFFSHSWISMASNLPRQWKHGSMFHRYAIGKLAPELLFFPEEQNSSGNTTSSFPPLRYWLGLTNKTNLTPFFNQSLYEDPALLDLLRQSLSCLDDIISPKLLKVIASSPQRRRLFFQLGALALWRKDFDYIKSIKSGKNDRAQLRTRTEENIL